jgi:hypothetical protein
VPAVASNPTAFLVDFLPVIRRTQTRTRFVVDHVHYFSNALTPWISRRERLGCFLIRRDPRDISRIWVLEPDGHPSSGLGQRSQTTHQPLLPFWPGKLDRVAEAHRRILAAARADDPDARIAAGPLPREGQLLPLAPGCLLPHFNTSGKGILILPAPPLRLDR